MLRADDESVPHHLAQAWLKLRQDREIGWARQAELIASKLEITSLWFPAPPTGRRRGDGSPDPADPAEPPPNSQPVARKVTDQPTKSRLAAPSLATKGGSLP
jgi:hypothetical protein